MGVKRSWTLDLEKHPIFQKVAGSHSLETSVSLIAHHGSEFFVASGSIVRYADLSSMKDYIELDLPEVAFPITNLSLNSARTILLIVGQSSLSAAFIPRNFQAPSHRKISTHAVGKADLAQTTVVQARVHPLCSARTSLVVVTSDGWLRLYDLNTSFDQADQTIDLLNVFARRSTTRHFLGDTEDAVPVDFCFGAGGDGWNTFTIFVLLRNGDLVPVCPLLPRSCFLTNQALDNFEAHVSDTAPGLTGAFNRLIQAVERGAETASGRTFVRTAKFPEPVVLEPVLFSPAPLEFSRTEITANTVCFLPLQPQSVLAIGYEGKVDVCLLTDPLVPQPSEAYSVTVYESIKISHACYTMFHQEPSPESTAILVSHDYGIHEIEMKHWLADIQSACDANDEKLMRECAQDGISSDVKLLLDTEKVPLIGCLVFESDLDHFVLALGADQTVHLLPLQSLNELIEPQQDDEEPPVSLDSEVSFEAKYQTLLSKPAYRPLQPLRGTKIVLPTEIGKQVMEPSVEMLRFLSKYILQARRDLKALMDAFVMMHRRLALQVEEFARQQAKVDSCRSSVAFTSDADSGRFQSIKSRQTELETRLAKLSQTLHNNHQPNISDAERRFMQELSRIQIKVAGVKGLIVRTNAAEKQFHNIKPKLTSLVPEADDQTQPTESPIRSRHLGQIKEQIECIDDTIDSLKSRLQRLTRLTTTNS